jgi:SAM-dependent methyltransferase
VPHQAYYDRYWSSEGFDPRTRVEENLRELLAREVARGDAVVDVGCGDGGTAGVWLAAHAASYVGVDVSEVAVGRARAAGLDARRIEDASALPFDAGSFDAAVCTEVLEHLVDPLGAVREMHRVLRPGGRLVVTVPNVAFWRGRLELAVLGRWNPGGDDRSVAEPWRDPHVRFFSRRALDALLRAGGFAEVQTGGHSGPWLHAVPGLRRLARGSSAGPVYRRLAGGAPSVFAPRLHAVARR